MSLLKNGYEIIEKVLSDDQIDAIKNDIKKFKSPTKAGGIRNAEKKFASIYELAKSPKLKRLVNNYLPGQASLVRAILFNKTEENNWLVTWHQDSTVAVSEKFEKENWDIWSIKDGINHVQPPVEVLNQMVTFRIHLDSTHSENGCLKVLPESHKLGVMSHTAIKKYAKHNDAVACEASAGSALVMRPHLLHASSKASKASQRRVIQLEYSSYQLPAGIA